MNNKTSNNLDQDFYYLIGLDYVSCPPYRVPVARVAAAAHPTFNNPEPDAIYKRTKVSLR